MTRPASAPLEPGRRITVDTNVLVRAVTTDDPVQSPRAAQVLAEAAGVVVTLPCWCEFVWVLRRAYGFDLASIEQAITALVEVPTVLTDRPAVAAGLALLRAGGDFADGVIAHLGALAGGQEFVSFDRTAVRLLTAAGQAAIQLDRSAPNRQP